MSTTSSTPSQTSGFRLLDLPPELRLYIYRYAFDNWNETRKTINGALIRNHSSTNYHICRMLGTLNNYEIYVTIPSGPNKLCYLHRYCKKLHQLYLPPLIRLDKSIVAFEAASLYSSLYSVTFGIYWTTRTTGGFRNLPRILKKWNLSDCRAIKHLTLEFEKEHGIRTKQGGLNDFDVLAAWTHLFASRDPSALPEPSVIHCKWVDQTNGPLFPQTNTLRLTWPKLLAGLMALGRQIRLEHILQDSGLLRSRPHIGAVEKRARLWINDWQAQDDFVDARKDLLRSWAAFAKFGSSSYIWDIWEAPIADRQSSQDRWDSYMKLPWSKGLSPGIES